jgi:hypothetical protein
MEIGCCSDLACVKIMRHYDFHNLAKLRIIETQLSTFLFCRQANKNI